MPKLVQCESLDTETVVRELHTISCEILQYAKTRHQYPCIRTLHRQWCNVNYASVQVYVQDFLLLGVVFIFLNSLLGHMRSAMVSRVPRLQTTKGNSLSGRNTRHLDCVLLILHWDFQVICPCWET